MVKDKFEFDWDGKSGDFLSQDLQNIRTSSSKVSVHVINKRDQGYYHAGVDTIDAFCYSWKKKLTEKELDGIYDDFLRKKGEPSDRVP